MKDGKSKSEGWACRLEIQGQYCSSSPKAAYYQNTFVLREVSFCSMEAFNWMGEAHPQQQG